MHYNYYSATATVVLVALGAVLVCPTKGSPLPTDVANDLANDLEEAQQSPLLEAWLLRRIIDICMSDPNACSELELARLFAHIHGGLRRPAETADDRDELSGISAVVATRSPEAVTGAATVGSGRSDASSRQQAVSDFQPLAWSKSAFGSLKVAASADGVRTMRGKRTTVNNILFEIFKRLNISRHHRPRPSVVRIADE